MQVDEARILLGFPPNSRPTQFQVKSAYKKKVWESHPDRFPVHEKCHAESQFKLLLWYLKIFALDITGARAGGSAPAAYTQVVRTGVPRAYVRRRNHFMIRVPFFLIVLGTVALGGLNVTRAYKRQKEVYPSHNPFLP
ncbi:uncharacterized protein LOC131156345 isoform X1 [Malania oleifera]|uniref:uncharacterized protein LOC131156345 isoform X1 n=1 Tax=Malania oleifera TaxID=397392 RepID=UPI0025AE87D7|nr:uncharacterized protein LOC131156345 isoform X1 [Malania oleifera]